MLLVNDRELEFDFPIRVRRPEGQSGPLFYEPVDTLPELTSAEEQKPFSDEQVVKLRTVLKGYDVTPYSLKMVTKNTNGVVVGATESVTFRIPVAAATEQLQRLLPDLFSAVHGVDAITSLDLQTGNNK
jgi:hypothetical protein